MAEQEFRIHIVSDADNTGFKSAGASSAELRAQLVRLEEEQRLANVQGLSAVGLDEEIAKTKSKLAAAIKSEVVPAVELETLSHRETRKVLNEIGNVVAPGAGRALGELAFGPVGAALALTAAFEYLRKKIEDVEKQEEELNQEQLTEHQKSIDDLKQAWVDTKKALGDYYAEMNTAGTEKDPTKKQLENIKAVTDAQLESSKKIIEALGKQEIAWLRAHGGTEQQIAAAEERMRMAEAKIDSQKEFADGVGGLQQEQKMRSAQDYELQRKAIEAVELAGRAKEENKKNADELAFANEALDPSKAAGKALAKKQQDAADLMAAAQGMRGGKETVGTDDQGGSVVIDHDAIKAKAIADAQVAVDAANAEFNRLVARQAQLSAKVFPLQEQEKETGIRAAEATGESETNRGRLRELPGEIQQAQRVQSVTDTGESAVEVVNTHGGKTNASLGELAAVLKLTEQQKLNIISGILNHTLNLQSVFVGLESRLSKQEADLLAIQRQSRSMPSQSR
jgi:hypothetical protein